MDRPDLPGQVQEEVGPGVRTVREGVQAARLLADDEPVAPGVTGEEQGVLELQMREGADEREGRETLARSARRAERGAVDLADRSTVG